MTLDTGGNVSFAGRIDGLSTPGVATGTGSSSGGTLAAATYYTRIVAVDSAGNTTDAGPESTGVTTTGSTSSIAYTWAAVTGATNYRVYVSTTSGTYTGYFVTSSASYTLTTTSGTTSAGLPASNATGISLMPNQSFMRNRIINGAMVIDQRNNGSAVTTTGSYPVDRWVIANTSDGAFSAQRSTTAPAGFANSLIVTTTTADATLTTTQQLIVTQNIEGFNVADFSFGTASALTVTISFWTRSSLTGTFGGALKNSAANRSYPFTYSISSANTWEYKTVTIAGDTTGTWLTDNGVGLTLVFGLGAGPDRSGTAGAWNSNNNNSATGTVSVIGTLNATWYITGVQLEVGSVATPFERRQYGQELALCQRYYWRAMGTATGAVGFPLFALGQIRSGTTADIGILSPTTFRSVPAINFSGTVTLNDGATFIPITSINTVYGNPPTGTTWLNITASAGGLLTGRTALVYAQNASTNWIDASAEL
jgi:hypothetical protein